MAGGGGGTPPGVPVWRKYDFDHTLPNLDTGVVFYTPAAGELFLGALLNTTTVWNGTTPSGDIGPDGPDVFGWFRGVLSACDMTATGAPIPPTLGGLSTWDISPITFVNGIMQVTITGPLPETEPIGYPSTASIFPDSPLPAVFPGGVGLRLCISQDGTTVGGPTGATQGKSTIYFATVKPIQI
jgi:hypothetical protein